MNNDTIDDQPLMSSEEENVLKSIKLNKVILPILIGVGVVCYLVWKDVNVDVLAELTGKWNTGATIWVIAAVLFVSLRHLAYMTRLRVLTDGEFTWKKCFELIFIWEFSSAVTPTTVGGSAVAMFVLSQEKLAAGKITTIVFYTVIFDTFFFILGLPILLLIFGPEVISPGGEGGANFAFWQKAYFFAYGAMVVYGSLFFYGIIINPKRIRGMLVWLCSNRLLSRFKERAVALADDMVLTAKEIKHKPWTYHAAGFGTTAAAWSLRFITVMCLMLAFVSALRNNFDIAQQALLYGRLEIMYVVLALSPTPGGSGIAEAAFYPFLTDFFINMDATRAVGTATIVVTLWRVLTYYSYLLAGAIVIPNWIRNVLNKRKIEKSGGRNEQ